MLSRPIDILSKFPVRKTKQQKLQFRQDVIAYCECLGYPVAVEECSFGGHNLIIGNPKSARYLVTAHYDTPARLLFPNFAAPENRFITIFKLSITILIFSMIGFCGGFLTGSGNVIPGLLLWLIPIVYPFVMLLGPANQNNANDNTSGVVTLLETARTMPINQRDRVCFVLFDLEEAGLIGSGSYQKAHKEETEHQIVLNLDCVGDGDEICFYPMKTMRKQESRLVWLRQVKGNLGPKTVYVKESGFVSYASDQRRFPNAVAICALHRSKYIGRYFSRIHTVKDTILDETNVNILRACLTTLISSDAAK